MIGLIIGLVVFFVGWAIRSTFLMRDYTNKPIGGILIAIGMMIIGIFCYKLLKK